MDILGVGGWELVAILLIMLVVAGPKRMIAWSYTLGTYVSKLRKMWAETAKMLQKEFDEAGVDVKVPTDIPTRATLNREIGRALTPVTKPLQETLDATKKEMDSTKQAIGYPVTPSTELKATPPLTPPVLPPAEVEVKPPVEANPAPSSNGHPTGDFGTWSQKNDNTTP